ncbi:MAG TPA: vWA domain-containing protein, partial [Myxococcota bacterium]
MRFRPVAAVFAAALVLSPVTAFAKSLAPAPTTPPTTTPTTTKTPVEKSGLVPTIKPRVDLVFVLDTTGSMGGLIDGAKRKIWAIANEVASAQQKPDVRIGLVAYRDRGDAYVTKVVNLSDNLDSIYEQLMAFQADGGGDGPEDVNEGLHDAVTKMAWSTDKKALKMVFLVGDAPPHMDYAQQVQWQQTAKLALKQNIYINTIQCGADDSTTLTWREIAHAAEGRYAAIPQDGGVRVAAATPYDAELARLAGELDATNFTYGGESVRREKTASRKKAESYAAAAPMASSADRAVAKNALGSGMKESEDLVTLADNVGGASAALSRVKADDLPDELKGKDKATQTKIIAENQTKRAAVQAKITALAKQRDQHLAEEA